MARYWAQYFYHLLIKFLITVGINTLCELSSFLVSCILLNVAKTLFYSWNRPSCVLVCASVCLALLPAQFTSPFGQIWPLNKEEFEQTKTVIWLLSPDETWNSPLRRCSLSLQKHNKQPCHISISWPLHPENYCCQHGSGGLTYRNHIKDITLSAVRRHIPGV